MKIVLASSSPRRKDLLKSINMDFTIKVSDIDETFDSNLSIVENVKLLALKKAKAVSEKLFGEYMIIGSDTIVIINNKVLGKPQNIEEAKYMLNLLSNNKHEVITSIALYPTLDGLKELVSYRSTSVYFRKLSEKEINNYVKTDEPMDKAGSYALQGIGSQFVDKIEGCYTNVIGLSLPLLSEMFKTYNIDLI